MRDYADYRQLVFGLALVAVILMRPMGIFSRHYGPSWLVAKLGRR
jgi:branched-chain amino acid transport system permease protein